MGLSPITVHAPTILAVLLVSVTMATVLLHANHRMHTGCTLMVAIVAQIAIYVCLLLAWEMDSVALTAEAILILISIVLAH